MVEQSSYTRSVPGSSPGGRIKMEKHYLYILSRTFFLFFASFLATGWLFSSVQMATQGKNVLNERYETSYLAVPLSSFLKDISPAFKIPFSFLRFNIYANNNVIATIGDRQATSTLLSINVLGKYTGQIKTGQTKIVQQNISSYDLSGLSYERSFNIADSATTTLRGDYTILLKPTHTTFIATWMIIIIPVTYAFIVIFSSCLKFILLGHPFVDVINKFKKIK